MGKAEVRMHLDVQTAVEAVTEVCIYKSKYAADTIYGMPRSVEVESE